MAAAEPAARVRAEAEHRLHEVQAATAPAVATASCSKNEIPQAACTAAKVPALGWGCSTRVFDLFPRLLQVGEAGALSVTGEGFNCLANGSSTLGYEAKAAGGTASVGRFAMLARVARVNDSHLELRFDAVGSRQTAGMSTVHLDLSPSIRHQPTLHTKFSLMFVDFAAVAMPPQLHLGCGRDLAPGWFNMDALTRRSTFYDWGVQADLADRAAAGDSKLRRSLIRWSWSDGLQAFGTGSVRAITVSHALVYCPVSERTAMIKEFARVLRPLGVVRVAEHAPAESELDPWFVHAAVLAGQMRAAGLCPAGDVGRFSTHGAEPDGGILRSSVDRGSVGFILEGVKVPACDRLDSAAPLRSSADAAAAAARAAQPAGSQPLGWRANPRSYGANPGDPGAPVSEVQAQERFSADTPDVLRVWLDNALATISFLPGEDALEVAAAFCADNAVQNSQCTALMAHEIEEARRAAARAGAGGGAESHSTAPAPAPTPMLQAQRSYIPPGIPFQ